MADQQMLEINVDTLVPEAQKLRNGGWRMIQICATRVAEGYDLLYSFSKEYDLLGLHVSVKEDDEVPSISAVFEPAFLYENEIKDLFGVKIQKITLDYEGNFYRIEQKTPYK